MGDYTSTRAAAGAGASRNPADMTIYYRVGLAWNVGLACVIALAACSGRNDTERIGASGDSGIPGTATVVIPVSPPSTLSDSDQRAGWQLLFDGKTFAGWRGLGYDSVPTAHWKIENGTIRKLADGQVPRLPDGQPAAGGDLMSRDTFRDFELTWEWKISRAGNSGVKYNVSEQISMANAPNHAALGFEYQMLDDSLHEDNKVPSHRAGALYDLIPPNANKVLAPVGEWNASTIVFRGNHGEHWLNGKKVVEFDLGTPQMDSLLANSKYRDIKNFAKRRAGHIVLQDHVDEVYFRNIKIRRM